MTSNRSCRLHPVSIQSSCRYVFVGQPTLAHPCEKVHRRMSLMCSSLLLQQCPTCFVHPILIVLGIGGRWSYSCCFVGYCFQKMFNTACNFLVQFLASFFLIHLVSIHVVHPYSRIDNSCLEEIAFYFIG